MRDILRKQIPKRMRYFAYGSNMLQERLEQRVGRVKKVGVGSVEGYELQFNCAVKAASFANVVAKAGSKVSGVIYEMSPQQFYTLDFYEGLYEREIVQIHGKDTIMYISHQGIREGLIAPTRLYIQVILMGYKQNGLMQSYRKLRERMYRLFGEYVDV